MSEPHKPVNYFIRSLEERAKELHCLYKIDELIKQPFKSIEELFHKVVKILPEGFQYVSYCDARIIFNNRQIASKDFLETQWVLSQDLIVRNVIVGSLDVFYIIDLPTSDDGPFLSEEKKLLKAIADKLSDVIFHSQLSKEFQELRFKNQELTEKNRPEWAVILEMLRKTDQNLFSIISRKMINHLFCKGIAEAKTIFRQLSTLELENATMTEINRPSKKQVLDNSFSLGTEIFDIALKYLKDEEILSYIQKWINEEKTHFLVKALSAPNSQLSEITDAIRRYHMTNPPSFDNTSPVRKGIVVSLIRRFLTDQLEFIDIAKNFCDINDFYKLLDNLIYPADSQGKLGGKGSGLFLAKKILEKSTTHHNLLSSVKTPKTWYITSDSLMNFIYYNNMEDIVEQKYKEIDEIRQEYSHIIQAYKNSSFPQEIANGLSRCLDDFGDHPIIVRSSSLLEDRAGAAFAGKYKSLFLANQGKKQEKLEALLDAVAEVYASVFGPDPIGYRIERGLLDFNEEMAIMIQEVVGTKVGKYFFPAFAGVAFSSNEFRWSPRIKREDGLIRLVPGLGTRAVDRVGEDFPVLIAPGQPSLRVNLTYRDILNYSPKMIDVINLETNTFETISLDQLIFEIGDNYPIANQIFSIIEDNYIKPPIGLGIDSKKHQLVVTFDNLVKNSDYIKKIELILKELQLKLGYPVDIEFACNGKDLYLLQSRPQSSGKQNVSVEIPKDIDKHKIIFTASKYISNGFVPPVNYIIYVDPEKYSKIENYDDLKTIGKIVGKLNQILPKKQFILMGPGRWGSRGDIRLGVSVGYSDINNTSMLVEIAKNNENYAPDLSFGTHFFQDLVEADIKYLPLFPDEAGNLFKSSFFEKSNNILSKVLPEFEYFTDIVKVINIPESYKGFNLKVIFNADQDEAIAYLNTSSSKSGSKSSKTYLNDSFGIEPWRFRMQIAEKIAERIDKNRFKIRDLFVFGTTFNKTAMPGSDLDLLIQFDGNSEEKRELDAWLEAWNYSLSDMILDQTGYKIEKFLDIYFLYDNDLEKDNYYLQLTDISKNLSLKLKTGNNS